LEPADLVDVLRVARARTGLLLAARGAFAADLAAGAGLAARAAAGLAAITTRLRNTR
jgi:hypothetical protein